MWETIKNDPILKTVTIIVLSVLGFGFAFNIMFGPKNNGMEGGMFGMNGNSMIGYQTTGLGLEDILVFLLKLLLFVSVAGVIVGVFMFVKQNYSKQIAESIGTFKTNDKHSINCPKCQAKVSDGFKYCPSCAEKLKQECAACGAELKPEWKCCPGCGAEKL